MRIFIPVPGTEIILGQDWEFRIRSYGHHILAKLGVPKDTWTTDYGEETSGYPWNKTYIVTLPAGTKLRVTKFEVKGGVPEQCLTFMILDSRIKSIVHKKDGGTLGGQRLRFNAYVEDVNRIEYDLP